MRFPILFSFLPSFKNFYCSIDAAKAKVIAKRDFPVANYFATDSIAPESTVSFSVVILLFPSLGNLSLIKFIIMSFVNVRRVF